MVAIFPSVHISEAESLMILQLELPELILIYCSCTSQSTLQYYRQYFLVLLLDQKQPYELFLLLSLHLCVWWAPCSMQS